MSKVEGKEMQERGEGREVNVEGGGEGIVGEERGKGKNVEDVKERQCSRGGRRRERTWKMEWKGGVGVERGKIKKYG